MFIDGNIPNTIADFGVVPYGHSISGRLVMGIPFDGCDPLTLSQSTLRDIPGNLIIFLKRGRCNFSQKVINAQKIGASAVIISDNDEEKNIHKVFAVERVKMQLDQVKIPSMLINKENSEKLEQRLIDEEGIELDLQFDLRKAFNKSKLSFILSVDDYRCYDSLLSLEKYMDKFKNSMEVSVHYKVFRNIKVSKNAECIESEGNKFCGINSFGNKANNQGLMSETLRQMCAYKYSKQAFFKYLAFVRNYCFEDMIGDSKTRDGFADCTRSVFNKFFSESPQKEMDDGSGTFNKWGNLNNIPKADLDPSLKRNIVSCANVNGNETASLFEQNNDDIKYYLINYSPIVFINGAYYKGNFDDVEHLLEAFCSSFEKEPIECQELNSFKILQSADTSGFFNFILMGIFATVLMICIIALVFYVFYRKRIRGAMDKELHSKINNAIANYYGTNPVDLENLELSKEEKNNLDLMVQKIDKMAACSVKESNSSRMSSKKSTGIKEFMDSKSLMNLQKVQDQIESEEEEEQNNKNNMTFN
jgi:hypothetical protein